MRHLKTIAVFALIAVYLLVYTPCSELLKLPVFIAHFQEHQSENPNLSLASFLKLHYMSGNTKDADYDRDMQLPFKTGECIVVTFSPVIDNPTEKLLPEVPVYFLTKQFSSYQPASFISTYLSLIWQPPRNA